MMDTPFEDSLLEPHEVRTEPQQSELADKEGSDSNNSIVAEDRLQEIENQVLYYSLKRTWLEAAHL